MCGANNMINSVSVHTFSPFIKPCRRQLELLYDAVGLNNIRLSMFVLQERKERKRRKGHVFETKLYVMKYLRKSGKIFIII